MLYTNMFPKEKTLLTVQVYQIPFSLRLNLYNALYKQLPTKNIRLKKLIIISCFELQKKKKYWHS